MNIEHSFRYTILGTFFAFLGFLIVGQLVRLQISPQKPEFLEQEKAFSGSWQILQPNRGLIFDRSGNLLAGNETVYEVGIELKWVKNPETIALAASAVLGLNYLEVYSKASQPSTGPVMYVQLADYVLPEKIRELEAYSESLAASGETSEDGKPVSLVGLVYRAHLQRTYPEKNLASNILGFVNREMTGYFGLEEHFNDLLAGAAKSVWFPNDPNLAVDLPEVPDGASLILTIDREIQAVMEEILDAALIQSGASGGTILVMQPETGEVLAMASTPRMDLNEYWRVAEIYPDETPFNLSVAIYEPGSVFKVITMAAALDSGTVKPDTTFLDTGYISVGGIPIYNWDGGAWGPQTMLGCMQHSLNVCLAWVATQMGPGIFYDYLQEFGFGRPTGIELAEEYRGYLRLPGDSNWYESDLGTNSFGQGIAVTPMQMVMAISAVANDGKMMSPRLLKAVVDRGRQYQSTPQIAGTPISAETARTLTDLLAVSLEQEASSALVPGYRVAGKTGTAEIPTEGGYTSNLTNASFVGWGPVDDPQFLVYIWLQKPTTAPWGSVVAAPVFSQVVQRLVVLMNIPPDSVRQAMVAP